MKKKTRFTDDKGHPLYCGDVLMDWDTKRFYWVSNPYKGELVTISEKPVMISIEELEKKGCYLKRWIGKNIIKELL
jgi:hypothetical protein